MDRARIFENGRSMAVRLPKKYQFDDNVLDVYIQKFGNALILFPMDQMWETFYNGLEQFSDDFGKEGDA